jgi:cation:H+ antiporter
MNSVAAAVIFLGGTVVSLAASWLLVSRIERIGTHLGVSEALLGLLAALAADAPEIATAITAIARNQQTLGAGVVVGSNVFNLAALLGLGAVAAGGIVLHRKVVLFAGTVGIWVALMCLLAMVGVISPLAGLVLVLAALVPYTVLVGVGERRLGQQRTFVRIFGWVRRAVAEEELEVHGAIQSPPGRPVDALVAVIALVVVVGASVAVERAASTLGKRLGVPDIVVGAIVLAGITSLPNAVAAIYLARRRRGAATLSTALNSNALNVAFGFLLPAAVLGIGEASGYRNLVGGYYAGLTILVLVFAYADRGISRPVGILVLGAYAAFAAVLLISAFSGNLNPLLVAGPAVLLLVVTAILLIRTHPGRLFRLTESRGPGSGSPDEELTAG